MSQIRFNSGIGRLVCPAHILVGAAHCVVSAAYNLSGRRPCLSAMAQAPICRYSIATLTTLSSVT